MFKKIHIPKGVTAYLSSLFNIKGKKGEKFGFGGGKIISLTGEQYKVDPVLKERSEDGEFFLSVRFKPLSPFIKEAKIVNDKELKEIRKKSDDLLNIFIPLGRVNSSEQTYDGGFINQEFLLTKTGKEKRMAGFYDEGKVYIAGHLAKSVSGELINIYKTQTKEMGEGDFLFLNFRGAIFYDEDTRKEDFYLDSLGLTKGSENSTKISTNFYITDTDSRAERESEAFSLSFNYPIGQVVDGNFLTFSRGNIRLRLQRNSLTYFKETKSVGGCAEAVYETKTTYSIYPTFG